MRHKQLGVTLVELILSMVIISIALTGVLTVMNLTVRHSADPVVNHQAIAIAESHLEEVLLQAYASGGYSGLNRADFDDVDDYDDYGYDAGLIVPGVKNNQGNVIAGLASYGVGIKVSLLAPSLPDSVAAKKITVSVSGVGSTISLVGYRADY